MQVLSTALAKNTSTTPKRLNKPAWLLIAVDGTFDGETLTMQYSWDNSTWATFSPDGTPVTFTAADQRRYFLTDDMYFRFTLSNGAGTPANIAIRIIDSPLDRRSGSAIY